MAIRKKNENRRPITRAEAERIKDKYYALKKVLYNISNDEKYTERARKLAKSAVKGLEKWRSDKLELAKMSNYQSE